MRSTPAPMTRATPENAHGDEVPKQLLRNTRSRLPIPLLGDPVNGGDRLRSSLWAQALFAEMGHPPDAPTLGVGEHALPEGKERR